MRKTSDEAAWGEMSSGQKSMCVYLGLSWAIRHKQEERKTSTSTEFATAGETNQFL